VRTQLAAGACLASLAGLALGLDAQFSLGISEALCAEPDLCAEATQKPFASAPAGAWIWGAFAGMAWISFSWLKKRQGYENVGLSLGLIGLASTVFLMTQLEQSDCLSCKMAAACAAIVALAGLLSREKGLNSGRAFGSLLVGLSVALLWSGTSAQAKKLSAPWTASEDPALSGREMVLRGSLRASSQIVFYGDLSSASMRSALPPLFSIDESLARLVFVPLATDDGEDLAIGLHCANQKNAAKAYLVELLSSPNQDSMSIAARSRLSPADFQTCTDNANHLKTLKSQLADAKATGIEAPFEVLVSTPEGWYRLSKDRPLLKQAQSLLKPATRTP